MTRVRIYIWCIAYIAFMSLILQSCTTDVELCEEGHPHKATITYNYDWSALKAADVETPSEMSVILRRIVHAENFLHKYTEAKRNEKHSVSEGSYKFFTINNANTDYDLKEVWDFANNKTSKNKISDLNITCKTFKMNDLEVSIPKNKQTGLQEFSDENIYFHADGKQVEYVHTNMEALMTDSVDLTEIKKNNSYNIKFKPVNQTHNIDLYFDLKKEMNSELQFTIDSVFCILSGVPHRINVANGQLDIKSTNKLFFKTRLTDPKVKPTKNTPEIKDSKDNNMIRCYQNINVLGIVENEENADTIFTGPGILQLVIYTTTYDENFTDGKRRIINGLVNIHNALLEAKLQKHPKENDNVWIRSREHSELHINIAPTILTSFLQHGTTGGIPGWNIVDLKDEFDFDIEI